MAYSTDGFHLLFDKESNESISTVRFSGRLGSAKAYLYQLYEERLSPLLEGEVIIGKTYFIDYRYLGSVFLRIEGANSKTSLTEYIGSESINTVTKEVKALNVFSPKQALVSLLYPYEHTEFL